MLNAAAIPSGKVTASENVTWMLVTIERCTPPPLTATVAVGGATVWTS